MRDSLLLIAFYELIILSGSLPVRFWGLADKNKFNDSWQVLSWVNCKSSFFESYNTCANNYGYSLSYLLKILGITSNAYLFLGHLNIVVVSISLLYLIRNNNLKFFNIFTIMLVFSPPMLLLIERGNLDGIIFGSLVLALYFYRTKNFNLAFLIIMLATLFKFYPLPLLFFISFSTNVNRKIRYIYRFLTILLTFLLFFEVVSRNLSFPKTGTVQFGLLIWNYYLPKLVFLKFITIYYFVSILIFISLIIFSFYKYKEVIKVKDLEKIGSNWFFLVVFLPTYIISLNYDYRLIFFIAFIIEIYKYIDTVYRSNFKWLVLTAVWIVYPARGLEPLGDLVLEAVVCYFFVQLILMYVQKIKFRLRIFK